jgi:hypothetical protein
VPGKVRPSRQIQPRPRSRAADLRHYLIGRHRQANANDAFPDRMLSMYISDFIWLPGMERLAAKHPVQESPERHCVHIGHCFGVVLRGCGWKPTSAPATIKGNGGRDSDTPAKRRTLEINPAGIESQPLEFRHRILSSRPPGIESVKNGQHIGPVEKWVQVSPHIAI